jgi:hypothetical protein
MLKRAFLALAIAAVAVIGVSGTASASSGSSCWYSVRGCVSVGGYYKPSTGTYVHPYFRNYPGSSTYGLPKVPSPYGYSSRSYSYRPSYSYSPSYSGSYGYSPYSYLY